MRRMTSPVGRPTSPALAIEPLRARLDTTVRVPGSKSISNRALPVAAIASGHSILRGIGEGDDVEAMMAALRTLGTRIDLDSERNAAVTGTAGALPAAGVSPAVTVDARQSGTTARFLTAFVAGGSAPVRIDADAQMRARPMTDLVDAVRQTGTVVASEGADATLPYTVQPSRGDAAAVVRLAGDASSQFLSGLLLSGPLYAGGLRIDLTSELVSQPYVDMTIRVMEAFAVPVERSGYESFHVPAGSRYLATEYVVEPDASAASYFFAAAAIHGGRVTVAGLGRSSLQGDLGLVALLGRMGATVELGSTATTVRGPAQLRGIEADLANLSDMVPTLAVVAAFADSPTRITGVGFIRHKESDRIGNVVRELQRAGVHAEEQPDGLVIDPTAGRLRAARLHTYDDHRLAMAFALLGLRVDGIEVTDPTCVNKTYPGYWADLRALRP
jgi:3-phosphoshikimate 1-carboxyvinyltransferase